MTTFLLGAFLPPSPGAVVDEEGLDAGGCTRPHTQSACHPRQPRVFSLGFIASMERLVRDSLFSATLLSEDIVIPRCYYVCGYQSTLNGTP